MPIQIWTQHDTKAILLTDVWTFTNGGCWHLFEWRGAALPASQSGDDWTLTSEQAQFMQRHQSQILAAIEAGDIEAIHELASSAECRAAFGEIGFDEVWNRYEWKLDDE